MTIELTLRRDKGDYLTYNEIDANFLALKAAIEAATGGLTIASIEQDGPRIRLVYSDGSKSDQITLPTAQFRARGQWQAGAIYEIGDFYVFERDAYLTQVRHQASGVANDVAVGKVALFLEGGKDGEDGSGGGTGGIEEAPMDGRRYSRLDGEWARETDTAVWDWMPPNKAVDGAVVGLFRPRKVVRYGFTQPFNGVNDKTYSDVDYDLALYLFSPRTLITRFKKVNGTFVEDGISSDVEIPATGILTLETENAAVAPGVEFLMQTALAIQFDPAA